MLTLRLLGGMSLEGPDSGALGRATQRMRMALLAVLAMSPRRSATRDRIIALLWPESSADDARARLSSAVYDIRHALGPDLLESAGDEIRLKPGELVLDVEAFEAAVAERRWEAAVTGYAGPFLDGVHLDENGDFERWAEETRTRLDRLFRQALTEAAREVASRGDRADEAAYWERLAALAPYDPQVAVALIEALDARGDRAAALAHADHYAATVRRELAAEPDAAVLAQAERIRNTPPRTPVVSRVRTAPASRPGRQRVGWAVTGVVAVLALLTAAVLMRREAAPVTRTGPVTRIAVLPFRLSGERVMPTLGSGLVDLLALNLDGAGDLRAVDPAVVLSGVPDSVALGPEQARALAARVGSDRYLLGTAHASGGRLRIHATLHRTATGEQETEATVEGSVDQLLDLVDRLGAQLVAGRLTGSAERMTQIGVATAASLPAIKEWLRGEAAFRLGHYREAAEAFEAATRHDSTFALAHYRHSLATLWGDVPGASTDRHDAMALREARRLPERERQLVEAYMAWRHGDADMAEYLYRRMLDIWPEDVEGWHQLGETLFHYNPQRGRPVAESRAAFTRVLALDSTNHGARWHLALLDALEGNRESLGRQLEALDRVPADNPGTAREVHALLSAIRTERPEEADHALRSADEFTLQSLAWRLAVFLGDLDGAERVSRLLLEPGRNRYAQGLGSVTLHELAMARGKFRTGVGFAPDSLLAVIRSMAHFWAKPDPRAVRVAIDSLQRREDVGPVERTISLGELAMTAGDSELLAQSIATLDTITADSLIARHMANALRGYRAFAAGKLEEALQFLAPPKPYVWFGLAVSGNPLARSRVRFVRAEALFALGRDQEALGWYGTFGEHSLEDLVYLAPAQFRRGQIFERLRRMDEAKRSYARVVELWGKADPPFQPWVAQARAKLGGRLAQSGTKVRAPSPTAPVE